MGKRAKKTLRLGGPIISVARAVGVSRNIPSLIRIANADELRKTKHAVNEMVDKVEIAYAQYASLSAILQTKMTDLQTRLDTVIEHNPNPSVSMTASITETQTYINTARSFFELETLRQIVLDKKDELAKWIKDTNDEQAVANGKGAGTEAEVATTRLENVLVEYEAAENCLNQAAANIKILQDSMEATRITAEAQTQTNTERTRRIAAETAAATAQATTNTERTQRIAAETAAATARAQAESERADRIAAETAAVMARAATQHAQENAEQARIQNDQVCLELARVQKQLAEFSAQSTTQAAAASPASTPQQHTDTQDVAAAYAESAASPHVAAHLYTPGFVAVAESIGSNSDNALETDDFVMVDRPNASATASVPKQ